MSESSMEAELIRTITTCLDLENPRSFFLYAGAGSGKTRTVVEAMQIFRGRYGERFRRSGQRMAVITYTNAACDEIRRRMDFDPIFAVSTIHSFAWEQIRSFHKDISDWLRSHLSKEIEEIQTKQGKGRAGTKAAAEREAQISANRKRGKYLEWIKEFTYNPNGENIGKNSLNHAEVIAIASKFLAERPLQKRLLIGKHPIVLIDESQDTQKDLVDAFFAVQRSHPDRFTLALFGDTMQRIYADGKIGLEKVVPGGWAKPAIKTNHRCPKRIVRLLNRIRAEADGALQEARGDAPEGVVRLFLVEDSDGVDKRATEAEAARHMAAAASDDRWIVWHAVKVLTLEHHMAARRGGFDRFFEPLYGIPEFKTGLLDGTLSGVALFVQQVLPLVQALRAKDRFAVAQVVREHSPLMSPDRLSASTDPMQDIRRAGQSVEAMGSMWDDGADPALRDVLVLIAEKGLFAIPDVFAPILHSATSGGDQEESSEGDAIEDRNARIDAWRMALAAPFRQFEAYVDYISERSPFGTHQGIKGLEFARVMVILDDNEARGFMFSYEKLFGAKGSTSADDNNRREGKETSIDRTRRLFYVTCSRAKESLAVIVYTKDPDKVVRQMSEVLWFDENEVIRI